MNKQDLPPSAVVLDVVLEWSEKIGTVGTATVRDNSLCFAARNHRGDYIMLSTPIHFTGSCSDQPPRFVLYRLGPGVWKLMPSILDDRLHAYLTITNVPDPAPWESGQ